MVQGKSQKYLLSIFVILILTACGGGGGGSSDGGNDGGIPSVSTGGFTATSDNHIEGGQKEFAFGQSATFGADQVTATSWEASAGEISADGSYVTPNEIDSDTFTVTLTASNGEVDTRSVSLSPFPKYSTTSKLFSYSQEGQSFAVNISDSNQALAIASFINDTNKSGSETKLNISNLQAANAKKNQMVQNNKMQALMAKDARYRKSHRSNFADAFKKSARKSNKKNKFVKSRASDPIGTRDTFFHDEGGVAADKNFEKLYSGDKCLVYSEINSSTDEPYVSQSRGQEIGEAFEVSNPYHPTGRSIFDVVTEYFGNPWGISEAGVKINDGGRDGEEQVILLLYHGGSSYGYFYFVDEEEKGTVINDYKSNGAEIVYINELNSNDDIATYSTLAHEFQHLCDYNQKFILDGNFSDTIYDESFDEEIPTLFNEGASVFAEELNGFSMVMAENKGNEFIFNNVDVFLSSISMPGTPGFFSWGGGSDYGKGYLFWSFLNEVYGEDIVKAATHSSKIQPENIEEATGKKMNVLLQEFILAILQTESDAPIAEKYKLSVIDRDQVYFDTKGKLEGKFQDLNYIEGFPNDSISFDEPYQIKFYKLEPTNGTVSFTIDNLQESSKYSVQAAIVNK